jgi:hypothetical protein
LLFGGNHKGLSMSALRVLVLPNGDSKVATGHLDHDVCLRIYTGTAGTFYCLLQGTLLLCLDRSLVKAISL